MAASPESPVPPPPPEGQSQASAGEAREQTPVTHPLPDAAHLPHQLEHDDEGQQALTGTHPAQQNAEVNQKEENRGVTHEQLMKLSPEERMEYISKLPPEKWPEASRQLEVPTPIAGGAEPPQLYIAGAGGAIKETRVIGPERERAPSTFEQILQDIDNLQNQPPSPDRDRELQRARERRDELLRDANGLGLFDSPKTALMGVYYGARVKVTTKEKEGKEEYVGRSKLQELAVRQLEAREKSWETETRFWFPPQRTVLDQTYGGVIDYFYGESIDMIIEIVKDRHKYRSPGDPYPDNGLYNIWDGVRGVVTDEGGRALTDDEGNIRRVNNFDEVREAIETERRLDPYVSSRDYETWIQFVADDEDELEEMIPDIAKKIIRNLGTGEPNAIYEGVEQEKKKMDKALAYFHFRSEVKRRRVRSTLTAEINALGAYHLSMIARKSTDPYFNYAEFLATACQDTDLQDHLVDSWLLDRYGENMASLELYSGSLPTNELLPDDLVGNSQRLEEFREDIKDGGFWRYGKNNRETNKKLDGNHNMSALFRKQRLMRKRFEDILLGLKLRSMVGLLNIDNNGIPQGDPRHPAYQRLRAKFDALDKAEIGKYGDILDDDGNPTTQTRWQEYCLKAFLWEKEGKLGDPRTRPRVIFQHPLARAFRPIGFTDEQGNITQRSEFWDMFEKDPKEEKWYLGTKGRRLRQIVGKGNRAERILTTFQMDVTAGGPRHMFDVVKDANGNLSSPDGEIIQGPNGDPMLQIVPTLKAMPIKFDDEGKPYIEDVIPHFVLIRALSQQAITEDEQHIARFGEARRRFKIYNLLRNKVGIPIDSPLFAGWYEGAHDTLRPVLLKYSFTIPEVVDLFNLYTSRRSVKLVDGRLDKENGMDEKGTMAGWAEFERRFKLALKYAVKKKWGGGGKYFNFPGHDTDDGGGKEFRNANEPSYGISSYTVTTTSFIQELLSPCGDFGNELGCTGDGASPFTQLVGLWKGPDETVFMDGGYSGFIVNPRDPESWVKRSKGNFILLDMYNRGDKNKLGSFGALNTGLLAGVFHLRTLNRNQENFRGTQEENQGIIRPMWAYDHILEAPYEHYVDAAARVISPFMEVIYQIYSNEESNFGRNPESAKFMATMYWYSLSQWMDREWAEYRGVYGFAYDGVLPLARIFMHTVLKESALIFTDTQWDEIILGYSRVEYEDGSVERVIRYKVNEKGDTVESIYDDKKKTESDAKVIAAGEGFHNKKIKRVEVHEGILDAFPENLKKEIIERQNGPIQGTKWLPFGIDSYRPETLEVFRNFKDVEPSERTQEIYKVVVENLEKFTKPRRKVYRPAI